MAANFGGNEHSIDSRRGNAVVQYFNLPAKGCEIIPSKMGIVTARH